MSDDFSKETRINWLDEKGEPKEINIPNNVIWPRGNMSENTNQELLDQIDKYISDKGDQILILSAEIQMYKEIREMVIADSLNKDN